MPTLVVSSAWAQKDGQIRFEVQGGTLSEIIKAFVAAFPEYQRRLLDAGGEPYTYYNIYVDDVVVARADRLEKVVENGSVIAIIPPLAGG